MLLIADEVITGFGRTGNMFGTETYGMEPDIMTMAKQLSSSYLPISAVLINDRVYAELVRESEKIGTFAHGFTYSGHPVCAAVALETLAIYAERNIVEHVRKVAVPFQAMLHEFTGRRYVGEARGVGLIGAIELVRDKATKAMFDPARNAGFWFQERAVANGLIVRQLGDSIALCPPLILTEDDVIEINARLSKTMDDFEAWAEA